jgi:hypothetical protein
MGWSLGFDTDWNRDIGYGVPGFCDHPGCKKEIDRGLAYVCGAEPYGGVHGCGLFFCTEHQVGEHQTCQQCLDGLPAFTPSEDHPTWVHHKATDESWSKWREEQSAAQVGSTEE